MPSPQRTPPFHEAFLEAQADVARQQEDVQETPQGLGSRIPFFSSTVNCDSGATHAILGMPSPLSATGPPRASSTIPQTIEALDLTPLHRAVISGNVDLTRTLLEDGSNANCAARGGMTPLHYAAYQRNAELVRLLKNYGANLEAVTDKGRSVLFFAVRGHARLGSFDMLPYASQARPSQDYHTDEATVRAIDALYNHPAGWARLLRALALADKDGVTPLMLAAEGGFTQTVTMFLQRGARPDARDHAGQTALRYAAGSGPADPDLPRRRALVRLLLQADERVQACDLAHVLKLAGRNCTATARAAATELVHHHKGRDSDGSSSAALVVVADEVVRVCREMDVLDGLLGLAEQKGKAGLLELLLGAASRLDGEGRPGDSGGVGGS